jgi:hypothetical protein
MHRDACMPKSWDQKYHGARPAHVAVLDKPFAGLRAGQRLLIATPALLEARIRAITAGTTRDIPSLRAELAREHGADATCPTSTAIFLRIIAERALERMGEDPAPFWRVIGPETPLARKLSCGPDLIRHHRALEACRQHGEPSRGSPAGRNPSHASLA